jgi:serine/threonine protein kinase
MIEERSMQSRVGQQLGNYRLQRLLGKGGFAEVYLGEHVWMQSKAAVKVLYGPLATNDAQSFLQEARTLASLKHPNIVDIKDFDIEHDIPFLVMDYAPNGPLRQRHTKGQLVPLGTIVSYVLQIASALQYAHDRHIVHRDLKPDNMLIGNNSNIWLSDFGIAVLYSSTHSYVSKGPAGTYFYMAPEQITGKALPASDQYALGITVYEWLCGEVPFVGSVSEITAKHLRVSPPPLHEKRTGIPPQVEAVVMRALAKDPQQRFASVKEFALALQSSNKYVRSNSVSSASRNDSIVSSPSDKTSGFTRPASIPLPRQGVTPPLPSGSTRRAETSPPSAPRGHSSYPSTQSAGPHSLPIEPRRYGPTPLAVSMVSVVLLLTIGIGIVGAIFAGNLIGRISSAINTVTGETIFAPNTPENLINDFCRDVGLHPDYESAYEKYSKQLQDQVPFNDFVKYWSRYPIDRCDHQTIPTPSGNSVTASWSTHEWSPPNRVEYYTVTFVIQGNDEWKIDGMDTA